MQLSGKIQKRSLLLKTVLVVLTCSAILPSAAQFFPDPAPDWLSRKGQGSDDEAGQYYKAIGAPATFADWQTRYFFGEEFAEAQYYNSGDLGFGRDMNCRRAAPVPGRGEVIACYVVNHGFGPGSPPLLAANDAIDEKNVEARVAMVYDGTRDGQPNDVTFYVYGKDPNRSLLTQVELDSEGAKNVPHLCLACHGGTYEPREAPEVPEVLANSVSGANFLPFDLTAFAYSQRPGFGRADQEDDFKRLNQIVLESNPDQPIKDLILGWYDGFRIPLPFGSTFFLPRATQNDGFVLRGYRDPDPMGNPNPGGPELYKDVFKPYCQTCHVAQKNRPLVTAADINNLARNSVFNSYAMPHAEKTAHEFWSSNAPASLANNRGWSIQVTCRGNDHSDCAPPPASPVTLREAIRTANLRRDGPRDIITFALNGTFNVNRPGHVLVDNDAVAGDLDVTDDVTILGNGADKTIIDGNAFDRVFHILNGADVVMQSVAIQNGDPRGIGGGFRGGGILNEGSKLTLNRSVIRDNGATIGGGLTNQEAATRATAIIVRSTIGPGNDASIGGGIHNTRSTLILHNSTVSGNTANIGGGIDTDGNQTFGGATVGVLQSTITGNAATNTIGAPGGINNSGTPSFVSLRDSIVAGNRSAAGPADCDTEGGARFVSVGFNLVGQNGNSNGCPTGGTDRVLAGGIATAINTSLQGSPPFHALVAGSPAIDAIPLGKIEGDQCIPPSYDQRNLARPLDGDADVNRTPACDIGAYEASSPSPTTPPVTCQGVVATIVGTIGNDSRTGTAGPDIIHGLTGNDVIHGGGGNDIICGGGGDDRLFGEDGRDTLNGGPNFDRCNGGPPNPQSNGDTTVACERSTNIP
ncbi:MAG: choice-of-anchor Q domain-containing protein [Gammaproteobacteria bacterium]